MDDNNVVPIEKNLPHYAGWARCRECKSVTVDVCPVSTGGVNLECSHCGQMAVDLLAMTVDNECAAELARLRVRDDTTVRFLRLLGDSLALEQLHSQLAAQAERIAELERDCRIARDRAVSAEVGVVLAHVELGGRFREVTLKNEITRLQPLAKIGRLHVAFREAADKDMGSIECVRAESALRDATAAYRAASADEKGEPK